jgi:phosphoribosyl-AMP cyclohydrolase
MFELVRLTWLDTMNMKTNVYDLLEEGKELLLDFDKLAKVVAACPKIIPIAVQDVESKNVILIAYTNKQALQASIKTKIATFWSTTRNELWIKGATSGNYFELLEIFVNCEQNSLLYLVRPKGEGMCHTRNTAGKARDCFYRRVDFDSMELKNINP